MSLSSIVVVMVATPIGPASSPAVLLRESFRQQLNLSLAS